MILSKGFINLWNGDLQINWIFDNSLLNSSRYYSITEIMETEESVTKNNMVETNSKRMEKIVNYAWKCCNFSRQCW